MDNEKDKSLFRALNRHGDAFYVKGINQALFLMAENEFDYFFVDADTPQAHAFVKHLRHDPDLLPPMGLVLLTNNEEEDCEAWEVDAYLIRETAVRDMPYIFSHVKGARREPAPVIRIAPALEPVGVDDREADVGADDGEEDMDAPAQAPGDRPASETGTFQAGHLNEPDIRERLSARARPVTSRDNDAEGRTISRPRFSGSRRSPAREEALNRRVGRAALAALLLAALAVWAFAWGPLSSQAIKRESKKTVDAESPSIEPLETPASSLEAIAGTAPVAPSTSPVAPASDAPRDSAPPAQDAQQQQSQTRPAPAPATANHAPSVSISGPTQVMRGRPATYSASGSDPDGDPVSLSWTTRTMCWSTPGTYSLSVTASDGRGGANSDSISVTVI